jgi:hypothetical protein
LLKKQTTLIKRRGWYAWGSHHYLNILLGWPASHPLGGLPFIKYCEILFFLIKEIEKMIFKKILNIKTNEALESNLVL